tara:strand:+ start:664 stop:789 length:126 start_codon:yes stop_codon:yes gene_type:complete
MVKILFVYGFLKIELKKKFIEETIGMLKNERENHYKLNYKI